MHEDTPHTRPRHSGGTWRWQGRHRARDTEPEPPALAPAPRGGHGTPGPVLRGREGAGAEMAAGREAPCPGSRLSGCSCAFLRRLYGGQEPGSYKTCKCGTGHAQHHL